MPAEPSVFNPSRIKSESPTSGGTESLYFRLLYLVLIVPSHLYILLSNMLTVAQ